VGVRWREREIMIMPEKGGMKGERKCENGREREKCRERG
jgi:hypothetical protein